MIKKVDCQSEGNKGVVSFLIQLRLEHGLSIKELSRLSGINEFKLRLTEKYFRRIKLNEVALLAIVYNRNEIDFCLELFKIYKDHTLKGAI
jgi:hypothetical protein